MTARAHTLALRTLIAASRTLAAGPLTVPIAWDTEVPAFPVLLGEAGRATAILTGASAADAA